MTITNIQDVRGKNINWAELGKRLQTVREAHGLSRLEMAQEINLTEQMIYNLETGSYLDRKSTNLIWNFSAKWNLSVNWLINGIGNPHDPDPLELMPATLHVQRGAGIRLNYTRLESETGSYTDHVLEFVMAIDKFKIQNQVPFPTLTQIYEIITALGYRKSVPGRIAPLGYIIKHQQWAEKQKQMNEKVESGLSFLDKKIQPNEPIESKPKNILSETKRKIPVRRTPVAKTLEKVNRRPRK